jgi:hypothetical protein
MVEREKLEVNGGRRWRQADEKKRVLMNAR